jgi:hypothetical protein
MAAVKILQVSKREQSSGSHYGEDVEVLLLVGNAVGVLWVNTNVSEELTALALKMETVCSSETLAST